MGAAIRQAVRYINLISTGIHMQLRTSGDSAEFVYTRPHPRTFAIVGVEVALVRMAATLQTVVGDDFHLQTAHFTYPRPAYVAAYGPVFGPHLHFEQPENLLRFPAEYLGVQIPGSQAYLHTVLETRAQTELETLEQHSGITYQVRKCILTRLAAGEATIEHIAKDQHVSRQTLYRQLKAEETTFQDLLDEIRKRLVDEIRKRLAASYLLNEGYSIMETAFLLGFSEASAFHRAFKRWYQQSPATYIEAHSWSSGQARG
jgi:AraC-like DNA-binding protein